VRTSLRDMLGDLTRGAEVRALSRGVTIECKATELPELDLDPDRIGEAFLNIIDNAIDASAPGGVITVRSGVRHLPDPVVWIEIADSGAGVPPEVLPHLFQPFFTTKPVGEGSGIGLAIARRAVHDYGGDIEVMSEPGQGACFRITLPCRRQECIADESAADAENSALAKTAAHPHRPRNVAGLVRWFKNALL
jgi:signal transduction histidine kinase